MVKEKLNVPDNTLIDNSSEYKLELGRQLEGQFGSVLRPADFDSFNMDGAIELIGMNAGVASG
jgi:hypothetical protein